MSEDSANQANAGRDVFVSYASQDAAVADAVVEHLEQHGIRCWVAPRDVKPGAQYADAIVRAINEAKTLVLVLSQSAIGSSHVGREVERAASKHKQIIAFKIDAAALIPALEYFLSESQWIDVVALGMPAALSRLSESIGQASTAASSATGAAGPSTASHVTLTGLRSSRNSKPAVVAAVVLVGVVIAFGVAIRFWPSKHTDARVPAVAAISDKSIAVLPFTDMSEKKDQEYFSDGMAEEILDILVKVPQLKVIARTSSFQFKGRTDDVRHIGRELSARYVVEGSVRRAGERVRITAQLIDSADGAHVWSQSYERPVTDVLDMQLDLATGIARALQLSLGSDEFGRHVRGPNPEAYEQYLRGRRDADQWTKEGWEKARGNFEAALDIDPTFAPAWVALGMVYLGQADFGYGDGGKQLFHKARDAAHTALKLEPRAALAHVVLSDAASMADFDWPTAQHEMAVARELEPGNALVLTMAGKLAMLQGDSQQAVALTARAVELDPLLAGLHQMAEYAYSCDRRYADAEASIRQALRISPQYDGGHYDLAMLLIAQGRVQEALPIVRLESNESSRQLATAVVQDALGQHAEAEKLLLATQGLGDSDRAMFYGMRGDMDRAFTLLNRALDFAGAREDTNLAFIKCYVMWQPLHADARFAEVLRRMKLPP